MEFLLRNMKSRILFSLLLIIFGNCQFHVNAEVYSDSFCYESYRVGVLNSFKDVKNSEGYDYIFYIYGNSLYQYFYTEGVSSGRSIRADFYNDPIANMIIKNEGTNSVSQNTSYWRTHWNSNVFTYPITTESSYVNIKLSNYETKTLKLLLKFVHDAPTHKEIKIYSGYNDVQRWEKSNDNGNSWEIIGITTDYCMEPDPQLGSVMYRVLRESDGQYYDVTTMTYHDEVPEEIVCSPTRANKTVDEGITFSLDLTDDGYTYQWYHDGRAINRATDQTYTIKEIKSGDAGSYYCIITNPVSETQSSVCELTVNKSPQYINFPEIETQSYGNSDFALPETTDKGLTIQYSSSNQSVATIKGNIVHIVSPGETFITANQPGNADYLEAAYVSRKLVVNKISQSIDFPEIQVKTYEDLPFTLPQVTDKGLTISYMSTNPKVATISGNIVTITGAGTSEIIASQEGDATHYAASPISRTLTVNKQIQYLNFPEFQPATYGDVPIILNEMTDKNLPITYSADSNIVTIEGSKVTINRPGSTYITALQEGNTNYAPIEPIKRLLTISKAPQTIEWAELPAKTYGDVSLELPEVSDKGLPISYDSSNEKVAIIAGNIVTIVGAGTTDITAIQDGNEFYKEALSLTKTLVVSKATQIINFPELPQLVYGSAPLSLNATTSSTSTIRYESSNSKVATIDNEKLTVVGTGKCYITAYADGDNNYFSATPVERELNVIKAGQSIVFTEVPVKTYGDEEFFLNASSSNGQPVTFSSSTPNVISVSGNKAYIKGAGVATLTAVQNGDNNYNEASAQIQVYVNKASLILTADDKSRPYGDENPEFTITYQGFVNGDTSAELDVKPVITTPATVESNIGTYDLCIQPFSDKNYNITLRKGLLSIQKALLTVVPIDLDKEYGEPNPMLTVTYEGFKNGQTEIELLNKPYVFSTAKVMSDVGDYPIIAEGAEARNYDIQYKEGTLHVNKAILTAYLENAERPYGTEDKYEITISGYKGGEDESVIKSLPYVTTSADIKSDAGTYFTELKGGDAQNYDFEYKYPNGGNVGYLTISKAPLTITAEDKAIYFGNPLPRFTLVFSGFRNDDTEADLDQYPYISCSASEYSTPGRYEIHLYGGHDHNYEYNLIDGLLTIVPDSRVLVESISLSDYYLELEKGQQYILQAFVYPENATNQVIEWSSSDNELVSVVDGLVTAKRDGTVLIKAMATDGSGITAFCNVNVVSETTKANSFTSEENYVYSENGRLIFRKANKMEPAIVYNNAGILIYQGLDEWIDCLEKGIYFVRIGKSTFKIILK